MPSQSRRGNQVVNQSVNQDRQSCPSLHAKARSQPNARDISSDLPARQQIESSWTRGPSAISSAPYCNWNVHFSTGGYGGYVYKRCSLTPLELWGDRSSSGQLSTSRPSEVCQGQGWLEIKSKALFLCLRLQQSWQPLLLINKWINPKSGIIQPVVLARLNLSYT